MEKHQIHVSLFGKIYIPNLFKNKMEKHVETEKQCLLWAQVSNFTFFVKFGYYPLLSLAALTFYLMSIVVYCHLLYCLLGIPMFNHMAYSAIAWPNVPCTKLSHCLLTVIDC